MVRIYEENGYIYQECPYCLKGFEDLSRHFNMCSELIKCLNIQTNDPKRNRMNDTELNVAIQIFNSKKPVFYVL